MSGGHIENAVMRAAILAAEAGTNIGLVHLRKAASQEYREMGKLILT
jgi:hypothetical protein